MKWKLIEPAPGDMIRVKQGSIWHYGIYASDEEVIQFGMPPLRRRDVKDADVRVCASDVDAFLCGGFLEVAVFERSERRRNRDARAVLAFARESLGKGGYNILYNNCEHFAYECVTGKPYCSQTEDVRSLLRQMPLLDVYVARVPEDVAVGKVASRERQAEIDGTGAPALRRQRYCVWRLLEYAIEHSLGPRARGARFEKTASGAWRTEDFFFSLSHTEGAVAVALSRTPVGVDIESQSTSMRGRLAERITTEREREAMAALPEKEKEAFALRAWCSKEALFKMSGGESFSPASIESADDRVRTQEVTQGEAEYLLAIASDSPERLRLYTEIAPSALYF